VPVALSQPFGPLHDGASAFQVLAEGLATVDARGDLRLWRWTGSAWKSSKAFQSTAKADVKSLAVQTTGTHEQLLWLDRHGKAWSFAPMGPVLKPKAAKSALPMVMPRVQTQPMARHGDAADDPAIWVHPTDAGRSLILGTNKKQGLLVYDLNGREIQLLEVGRVNNVDLRQQVRLDNGVWDLAVATHRDDLSVVVFTISPDGLVREKSRIATGLKDIYGICLYQQKDGGLEIFVNDKDGTFQRYQVQNRADAIEGKLIQRFKLSSQPEACVADDENRRLFIGEEKRGVWVMDLDKAPTQPPDLKLILPVGGLLVADTEGLALYKGSVGSYLIVSSQGNNSYVVTDSTPPYKVRGAFRIGMNLHKRIDGASETDGIEATSKPLGLAFPKGVLVVQDGFKRLPDGTQNFKIVAWEDIASALNLP
jgi:3-phytase